MSKKLSTVFMAVVFLSLLVISCTSKTADTTEVISYLELNLNDSSGSNPFSLRSSSLEIFRVISRAARDENINGIILNIGSISRSRDQLWELRCALEEFKATGKKIVAFITDADIDVYMLASVADKIVMDELGILEMLGYSAGQGFVSQALEKLGIGVKELRYFEYKSAMESFTRIEMSDAERRQLSDYLDDIFYNTQKILTEARGWSPEEFSEIINQQFMHSAVSAEKFNLIDFIGKNSVQEAITELEDTSDINYFLYGDSDSSLTDSHDSNAKAYTIPRARGSSIIAIVYADGQTDMSVGMEAAKLSKIINDLADNGKIKAIVVRMNSPGGSAQAADFLAEAIRYAKDKKPVVVSMEQTAASGGYWASLTASHIMATPYTITGSIGVIGSWFYDNGFYEKIGVTTDILKRGDHSDLFSGFLIPYRNLTGLEEEQYKNYILDIYDVFVEKVAAARDMEKEEAESKAAGRIYSGLRAEEAGLIDSVGNFSDALKKARELADIPENAAVIYREYPEPTFFERMIHNFPVSADTSALDILFNGDIRYRLENNGKVMPILPLEFSAGIRQ